MEKTLNAIGNEIPSFYELVKFLSNCDNQLGELCRFILFDDTLEHDDIEKMLDYLEMSSNFIHKNKLNKQLRQLITIYKIINEDE